MSPVFKTTSSAARGTATTLAHSTRADAVRRFLRERALPALVIYSDMWRSNEARFFSNFMPYFNRGLLILPCDFPPTLLCGLSPRVYGWIRSVTTVQDVRPAGNFAKPLLDRKSTRLNSSHDQISYAVFCLKKKKTP